MRKILLLFCLLLTGAAWAEVTKPELTTNPDNPVYYVIKSYRSGNFACYVAEGNNALQQTSEMSKNVLWYFEANGEEGGVSIVPAGAPELKLASVSAVNETGSVWYVKENPHNTGYVCISLNSELNSNCWDDQGSGTNIGTWQPSAGDFAGTSWELEKVNIQKDQLDEDEAINFHLVKKLTALNNLSGLEGLASYADNLAAVKAATTADELTDALKGFEPIYVTMQCQNTRNYFKVGKTQASFLASPQIYEHVVQLVPVGDGSFYLKGFRSKTYVGDVQTSQQIMTTATAEIPFYIQKYAGYAVVRPTKYSDGSQNYIHNNVCVGWGRAAGNSQHILVEIEVPDYDTLLTEIIENAKALLPFAGVPGYYTVEALATLKTAIAEAEAATEAEAACDALSDAVDAAKANVNYVPTTDRYYTITNARGAMVYDPAHDESVDATNDNAQYIWNKQGDVADTDKNNLWGFIEKDGKYYMYNVGKRQFAAIGKGSYGATWIFSDKPAYITTDAGMNDNIAAPNVRVRATDVAGNTYTMSVSPNYTGPVITYDASGDGGVPMLFAVSTAEVDDEVTAAIEELLNDVAPYREALEAAITAAEALNIGEGLGQYSGEGFAEALAAAKVAVEADDATVESLTEAADKLQAAVAALTLNLPADGALLRIKGETSGNYLAAGNASNGKFNMSEAIDATTIFFYIGGKLINYASGLYNGMNASSWNWTGEDGASDVTFGDGGTGGGYTIQSSNAYFYDAGESADRGQTLGSNVRYRSWQLEVVTELPVVIDASGMATLYAPVALTAPKEVKAYAVSALNEATDEKPEAEVVFTFISGNIPACTGVVLQAAEAGTYNFAIAAEAAEVTSLLTGSVATESHEAGIYTLVAGEKAGLYKTTESGEVKGCTAYLPEGSADAYVFDDNVLTGIATAAPAATTSAATYDLSGRQVSKATRGLYIVGGQKVLVK